MRSNAHNRWTFREKLSTEKLIAFFAYMGYDDKNRESGVLRFDLQYSDTRCYGYQR